MITSSSTVIASSLAVMVEENRDSLEPTGRRGRQGSKAAAARLAECTAPHVPGAGVTHAPGLPSPPRHPSAGVKGLLLPQRPPACHRPPLATLCCGMAASVPQAARPSNSLSGLTCCVDQASEANLILSSFFSPFIFAGRLTSKPLCRAACKPRCSRGIPGDRKPPLRDERSPQAAALERGGLGCERNTAWP